MFDALIRLIEERMAQRGYAPGSYKWESIRVKDAGQAVRIIASNQYYFLAAKPATVPATLKIISDTEVFNEAADYAQFQFYGFKEFSGIIDITVTAPSTIDLEFIRVVPSSDRKDQRECA